MKYLTNIKSITDLYFSPTEVDISCISRIKSDLLLKYKQL